MGIDKHNLKRAFGAPVELLGSFRTFVNIFHSELITITSSASPTIKNGALSKPDDQRFQKAALAAVDRYFRGQATESASVTTADHQPVL